MKMDNQKKELPNKDESATKKHKVIKMEVKFELEVNGILEQIRDSQKTELTMGMWTLPTFPIWTNPEKERWQEHGKVCAEQHGSPCNTTALGTMLARWVAWLWNLFKHLA